MEELITQVGTSGGLLVVLIPSIIQILKKVPYLLVMQKTIPIYQILSIALGIGGAFSLGLATPVITGLIAGLAAGKGYDIVKGEPK